MAINWKNVQISEKKFWKDMYINNDGKVLPCKFLIIKIFNNLLS